MNNSFDENDFVIEAEETKSNKVDLLLMGCLIIYIFLDEINMYSLNIPANIQGIFVICVLSIYLLNSIYQIVKFKKIVVNNNLIKIDGELVDSKENTSFSKLRFHPVYKYTYDGKNGIVKGYERLFPPVRTHAKLYYDAKAHKVYMNDFEYYSLRLIFTIAIFLLYFLREHYV